MGMTLIAEHIREMSDEEIGVFSRSMADAVERCTPLAIDPEAVDLVATGDFVQSVRDRIADPDEAAAYTTGRGAGVVAAKTMPDLATGRVAVVIPVEFMMVDDEGSIDLRRRTLTHEFTHVAIHQAGEASNGCRHRLADGTIARADFVAIAGVAVEEFRAELAVHEAGWEDTHHDVSADVQAAQAAWQEAADLVGNSDFLAGMRAALQAVNVLCQRLAYVTASLVHHFGRDELRDQLDDDSARIFMRSLVDVPSGAQRTELAELDTAIDRVADAVHGFLRDVGFDYRDTDGPGAWFGFTGAYEGDA